MSGSQQWSSEMYSNSNQQVVQRSVQDPNLSNPLDESSKGQQMTQPHTQHPNFNSNAVNGVPYNPNYQFQTYQTHQMSTQEMQPLQYNSQQVPPSSQMIAQGNHFVVPTEFRAETALQGAGAVGSGTNAVYLNPTARQFIPANSGLLQRYQMTFQGGQIDHNQATPTQIGPYYSHHVTSKSVCSSQDGQGAVRAMLYGEVQGNEPLFTSYWPGMQRNPTEAEPNNNDPIVNSQVKMLTQWLTRQKTEIEKLQKDCIAKDKVITNLKEQSVKHLKELKKLKDRKTKDIMREQMKKKTNIEDVESHEIKTSRLRSVIKGQREEIERLNILFRVHKICVEDTTPRKNKDRTKSSGWKLSRNEAIGKRNENLEAVSLSSKYCSVNLDNDDNSQRNKLYDNADETSRHQTPNAKFKVGQTSLWGLPLNSNYSDNIDNTPRSTPSITRFGGKDFCALNKSNNQ